MSEKEILEKTIEFLEVLGKKAGEMILSDQRIFLSRYGIGSIESLRKFWKFKKKQLEDLGK
ncbi:SAM-dependent methyltransferase [Ilyobacter sp.]|uniref:SAM-dependent methyltransferase n=1 Tax=Ilyobacter sp. TaxID=3100343 RepID=UPI0035668EAF